MGRGSQTSVQLELLFQLSVHGMLGDALIHCDALFEQSETLLLVLLLQTIAQRYLP